MKTRQHRYNAQGTTALQGTRRAVAACLALSTVAACGEYDKPVEDIPRYTNDYGEEIFGPGYVPTSPGIESIPLQVGHPGAGYKVPTGLHNTMQDELLLPEGISAPATPSERPSLPLLRKHTERGVRSSVTAASVEAPSDAPASGRELPDAPLDGDAPIMTVHYVFVGQGDGAIVEFPCGVAVIDTGGEFGGGTRVNGGQVFVDYLTNFFEERPELDDTIDVLFTTHPHADHLNGLPLLVDDNDEPLFTVLNVVDNGQTGESGSLGKQTDFRRAVVDSGGRYSAIELSRQVTATGATNDVIDPFECDDVDPVITAFWGGLNEELPDEELLSTSEYSTPNNHSVIIRIDFGDSSFLFTGDLEDRGEKDLREQFADNLDVFDVDVYQVSHHGADDDTSDELLDIMTPNMAVISMGTTEHEGRFTAFDHGHPRIGLLAVLQDEPGIVFDERDPAVEFPAARVQEVEFEDVLIEKAIFGTGWEGTVLIEASSLGEYEIFIE